MLNYNINCVRELDSYDYKKHDRGEIMTYIQNIYEIIKNILSQMTISIDQILLLLFVLYYLRLMIKMVRTL